MPKHPFLLSLILLAVLVLPSPTAAQEAPTQAYLVYVVSETTDEVSLLRFGPDGARVEKQFPTGIMPTDVDGPHGLDVAPGGEHYYVSLGHGKPYGSVWKYRAGDDAVVGQVTLGLFPATLDVSPNGQFAYVVNFNLHGDMVPSSVSVVATELMIELTRIPTCTMPHASRLNPQGTRHYSACMMDDMLVEIDATTFKVARHFVLTEGTMEGRNGAPYPHATTERTREPAATHTPTMPMTITCSPTWAQPSHDGGAIFVACNKSNEIVEIDAASWAVTRRIPAGEGVYNLGVTSDGRLLIASNKRGQSASVFDIASGRELARLPTKRKVVHGVAVSPDNRYAFISVEGVGDAPGTVEMIDLESLKTIATVDVGHQAAGLDVWKRVPASE